MPRTFRFCFVALVLVAASNLISVKTAMAQVSCGIGSPANGSTIPVAPGSMVVRGGYFAPQGGNIEVNVYQVYGSGQQSSTLSQGFYPIPAGHASGGWFVQMNSPATQGTQYKITAVMTAPKSPTTYAEVFVTGQ